MYWCDDYESAHELLSDVISGVLQASHEDEA